MDVTDFADIEVENNIALQVKKATTSSLADKIYPIGVCHYCEEEVSEKQLFCANSNCAKKYDEELKRRK